MQELQDCFDCTDWRVSETVTNKVLNTFYCRFEKNLHTPHPPQPIDCPILPLVTQSGDSSPNTQVALTIYENNVNWLQVNPPDAVYPSYFKSSVTELNDYRPVTLISVIMKSFEHLVSAPCENDSGIQKTPLNITPPHTIHQPSVICRGLQVSGNGHFPRPEKGVTNKLYPQKAPSEDILSAPIEQVWFVTAAVDAVLHCVIESILCTSITVLFEATAKQERYRLQKTVKTAE